MSRFSPSANSARPEAKQKNPRQATIAPLAPPSLEDLYSEPTVVDVSISPSGRYIATIVRQTAEDLLVMFDLQTNERKVIQRAGFSGVARNLEMKMAAISWKSEERLLLRLAVRPVELQLEVPVAPRLRHVERESHESEDLLEHAPGGRGPALRDADAHRARSEAEDPLPPPLHELVVQRLDGPPDRGRGRAERLVEILAVELRHDLRPWSAPLRAAPRAG